MSNLSLKINKLQSGDSFLISKTKDKEHFVERSGDGKTLRFVRSNTNGFVVYREERFYIR
jgi:hypothetical protein